MFENLSSRFQAVFKKLKSRGKLTEANMADAIRQLKLVLLEADVNYRVVKKLLDEVQQRAVGKEVEGSLQPAQKVIKIVHEELTRVMGPPSSGITRGSAPSPVMLVGLQGCGKTSACAKLGYHLKKQGKRPLLIAADIRRPAAREQLRVLAEEAGVDVFVGKSESAVEAAARGLEKAKQEGMDTAIIDTGGRLHIDDVMMRELDEMKEHVSPHEILLVVDAMAGQDAVREARDFDRQLGVDGMILTKLDGDTRGGAAISVTSVTGKPVKFITVGETIQDLEEFFPDRIASRIMGMGDVVGFVEKVEQAVAEDKKKTWERKIRNQQLNLQDLLEQMELTRKIGSPSSILGMIPDAPAVDEDEIENRVKRMGAIIRSMTADEKTKPSIIDGSRRRRIAQGSGTSVREVNQLLKQFSQMKKVMKKMQKHPAFPMGGIRKWQL